MQKFIFSLLCLACCARLSASDGLKDINKPQISYTKAAESMFRGLTTYGGKTFAIYMLGANPATATIVLVGLGASQVAGLGFDKFVDYLYSENPEYVEINNIDDFIDSDFEMINCEGGGIGQARDGKDLKSIEEFRREEGYLENYQRRATGFCKQSYRSAEKTIVNLPTTISDFAESIPGTMVKVVEDMPKTVCSSLAATLSAKCIGFFTSAELLAVAGSAFIGSVSDQKFVLLSSSNDFQDGGQALPADNDGSDDSEAEDLCLLPNGELVSSEYLEDFVLIE